MNASVIFDNETYPITATTTTTATTSDTIRTIKKYYVATSPFDSWYIGGLLFMVTVILVLLYANFYRENTLQILWTRILLKLHCIQPVPQAMPTSHPARDTLLP